MDGVSANHTDELEPADNAAVTADENAQDENDSEAGDEDSEDDDDDIQVTIGDIKTTYESVLLLLGSYSLYTLIPKQKLRLPGHQICWVGESD